MLKFLVITAVLYIIEVLYFKIANRYNITDHPNVRSSHTKVTLRGGGIIFPIAALLYFVSPGNYGWFITGLFLISLVSFWDDVKSLPSSVRLSFHFIAVSLLIYQLDFSISLFYYPIIFILIIGILNAYNFMDGINGITGGYSLVTLISLLFINSRQIHFVDTDIIVYALAAAVVFNFFNFRGKAICFAGDVGSVSIAFILCFLLIRLIAESSNFLYAGFLLIYGLDTASTILFRLVRKENITEAHRSHFYQFLANDWGWAHLSVSTLYCLVQLAINLVIIIFLPLGMNLMTSLLYLIGLALFAGAGFLALRFYTEGREKLLYQPKNRAV